MKVFDGSDDGKKVYDTLAVIGRRLEPGAEEAIEAPLRTRRCEARALAGDGQLFHPGRGEQTRFTRSPSSSTRTASAGP